MGLMARAKGLAHDLNLKDLNRGSKWNMFILCTICWILHVLTSKILKLIRFLLVVYAKLRTRVVVLVI